MSNIQQLAEQTKIKLDQINQLREDIDKLWEPLLKNLNTMSEEEVGEILKATNFYQAGFHIIVREFARNKFF